MNATIKPLADELKGVTLDQVTNDPKYCYDLETIAQFYLELSSDLIDGTTDAQLSFLGYNIVNRHFAGCIALAYDLIVTKRQYSISKIIPSGRVIYDFDNYRY